MKVRLENITKQYEEQKAVDNISLSLPENKLTVILGPSGSGKTTLLKLIAGLLYPSSGKIYFDEVDITDQPANKRNVAMVFQRYTLFPHMTVEQNLRFPLESQKEGNVFKKKIYDEMEIKKRVHETLELLLLKEHKDKYPSQLSGGEQQRVAIGREMIRDPQLFLFDEPLSNIDVRLRHEMRTWIRKVHGIINKTMIYVTHDQTEAMALGSNIILLNEGRIVQVGKPEDLYENPFNKFAANFIGNYPMNFLPISINDKGKLTVLEKECLSLQKSFIEQLKKLNFESGYLGFRAEDIREFDSSKAREEEDIYLDCRILDIEKRLDQQVLTIDYLNIELYFLTKTRKQFKINDKITILVHQNSLFFFEKGGKKIFPQ